jgi:probable HAF family extracellular repeat protein
VLGENGFSALLWSAESNWVALEGIRSQSTDLNKFGEVVGTVDDGGVIWSSSGVARALGALGAHPSGLYSRSYPYAVNDKGWVVGYSTAPSGGAFLWTRDSGMRSLGYISIPGKTYQLSAAYDVNNAGVVVGSSWGVNELDEDEEEVITRAFIWTVREGMRDLTTLIADTGWQIGSALAINNRNEILATALRHGQWRFVLLVPKSPGTK